MSETIAHNLPIWVPLVFGILLLLIWFALAKKFHKRGTILEVEQHE